MTEIVLHGLVSKKFKAVHKMANIKTPSDAIFAIDANYDGFKNFFLKEAEINNFYQFVVDGNLVENANEALEKKEMKRIDIVPYIGGSGPAIIAFVVTLAIGLVMAGIQYLMTPIPENEPRVMVAQLGGNSFWFASKYNITNQFVSTPIGYGELRVGSTVIETQIKATNRNETIAVGSSNSVSSSAGGGGGAGGSY